MRTRSLGLLLPLMISIPAVALADDETVATSANFTLLCPDAAQCGDTAMPGIAAQGHTLLSLMEDAYSWLDGLGFPVEESNLEKDADGRFRLRIDPEAPHAGQCGENTVACHLDRTEASATAGYDIVTDTQIFLPQANLGRIADEPSTLAHEFVHSMHPKMIEGFQPREEGWFEEAVAEAVGTMFGRRHGYAIGHRPSPSRLMTLDKAFYEDVDGGYGKWAYLIAAGQEMGSPDNVAYLSDKRFLETRRGLTGKGAPGPMELLYDAGLMGDGQTFGKLFPNFVALFNNVEESDAPSVSRYHYYADIRRESLRIPTPQMPMADLHDASVPDYAAAPILVDLEVISDPNAEPHETLMMLEIEITDGAPLDDLTLVVEHKLADEQHREKLMLIGSEPWEELGFLRIVNAPPEAQGEAAHDPFVLRLGAKPIDFGMPACFRAGEPVTLDTHNFSRDDAANWRLGSDNGTVDNVTVTPAQAGTMTISLEVDSPITRQNGSIERVGPPASNKIDLGTFDVVDGDCMVRLIAGGAELTYSASGGYTEARVPSGEAIYFSDGDLAAWEGGRWMPIPPMAKAMMMQNMGQMSPAVGSLMSSADGDPESFMARMPLEFSRRFSWDNLRNTRGPDGGRPQRSRTDCPKGGSGCSRTTFLMTGNPVPVIFDAQDRPVHVEFMGHAMEFDYGSWDIRRPPGW